MVPVLSMPLTASAEKAFRRVLAAVGEPWRLARTGRPPTHSPKDYALALFVRSFYGWSYRTAAAVLKIPKTCLHWAFKRLKNAWVEALVEKTANALRSLYAVKCAIVDSTGVSLRNAGFKRRFQRRPYLKLHAITEYAPWAHRVWFTT